MHRPNSYLHDIKIDIVKSSSQMPCPSEIKGKTSLSAIYQKLRTDSGLPKFQIQFGKGLLVDTSHFRCAISKNKSWPGVVGVYHMS